METESYKAIYAEMRTGVNRQVSEVDQVRAATGRAIGVAAVAMSIVGGLQTPAKSAVFLWVAVGLFAIAVLLTAWVWWPRQGWRFELGARDAISSIVEASSTADGVPRPRSPAEVYREMALHLEDDFDGNEETLGKLRRAQQGVVVTVAVLIIVLVVSAM